MCNFRTTYSEVQDTHSTAWQPTLFPSSQALRRRRTQDGLKAATAMKGYWNLNEHTCETKIGNAFIFRFKAWNILLFWKQNRQSEWILSPIAGQTQHQSERIFFPGQERSLLAAMAGFQTRFCKTVNEYNLRSKVLPFIGLPCYASLAISSGMLQRWRNTRTANLHDEFVFHMKGNKIPVNRSLSFSCPFCSMFALLGFLCLLLGTGSSTLDDDVWRLWLPWPG